MCQKVYLTTSLRGELSLSTINDDMSSSVMSFEKDLRI